MTDKFADVNQGTTRRKLLGNKGVSKVVDLGIFNAGDVEISVEIRADISDEESIAGFGDENGGVSTLGSGFEVFVKRFFNGLIKRDNTFRV